MEKWPLSEVSLLWQWHKKDMSETFKKSFKVTHVWASEQTSIYSLCKHEQVSTKLYHSNYLSSIYMNVPFIESQVINFRPLVREKLTHAFGHSGLSQVYFTHLVKGSYKSVTFFIYQLLFEYWYGIFDKRLGNSDDQWQASEQLWWESSGLWQMFGLRTQDNPLHNRVFPPIKMKRI